MRRGASGLPGALLAVAVACAAPPDAAPPPVKPAPLPPLERSLAITAAVRGQEVGEPVPIRRIPRAGAAAVLRAAADADVGPAGREAADETLGILGLWPPTERASEAATLLTSEQLLGFYVPRERALYVIEDPGAPAGGSLLPGLAGDDLSSELVVSHELAHALQHRAEPSLFDRARFFHAHADAATATAAAAEGDATRSSFLAVGAPQLPPGERFEASTREEIEGNPELSGAPALLRLEIGFTYGRGYALAVQEGPALLHDPPISTEQALHETRRREAHTALDLRDIGAPEGCSLVHEDEAGELGIRALFEDHGPATPRAAWEGWDGDRFRAFRCGDERGFVWLTLWDSDRDAAEFEESYRLVASRLARRARLAGVPRVRRQGREVRIATPRLEPALEALSARARRGRVATLDELFAFHGEPPRGAATAPPAAP